jgi:hypothetical protein
LEWLAIGDNHAKNCPLIAFRKTAQLLQISTFEIHDSQYDQFCDDHAIPRKIGIPPQFTANFANFIYEKDFPIKRSLYQSNLIKPNNNPEQSRNFLFKSLILW